MSSSQPSSQPSSQRSRTSTHPRHAHRGAHLTVHYGFYYHHGIDCGDGTVVHMSRDLNGVRRSRFEDFADGRDVYIEETPARFSPDEVIRRAMGRVGEGGYNPIHNNCEHFATWCREGRAISRQVRDVKRRLIANAVKTEGARVVARQGVKGLGKAAGKAMVKGGGLMLVVDGAQLAVEQLGGNLGLKQEEAKLAGRAVGLGGHLAIGASCGGPVGAVLGAAVWGVGELLGGLFD